LCGFTASVLRAGLMYGLFLLSRIFLKKRDGLNSLSIAVTIMLI
ncbi:MAG: ComEC/Rec2 family competence protein, partial [Clostridia bacterium]|nr:ComEC/Rec2 family competence protein [Clostridia bacterium]